MLQTSEADLLLSGELATRATLTAPTSVVGGPVVARLELQSLAGINDGDASTWRASAASLRISASLAAASGLGAPSAMPRSISATLTGPIKPVDTAAGTVLYVLSFITDRQISGLMSASLPDLMLELTVNITAPPRVVGVSRSPLGPSGALDISEAGPSLFMLNQAAEPAGNWTLRLGVRVLRPFGLTTLAERTACVHGNGTLPRALLNLGLTSEHPGQPISLIDLRVSADGNEASPEGGARERESSGTNARSASSSGSDGNERVERANAEQAGQSFSAGESTCAVSARASSSEAAAALGGAAATSAGVSGGSVAAAWPPPPPPSSRASGTDAAAVSVLASSHPSSRGVSSIAGGTETCAADPSCVGLATSSGGHGPADAAAASQSIAGAMVPATSTLTTAARRSSTGQGGARLDYPGGDEGTGNDGGAGGERGVIGGPLAVAPPALAPPRLLSDDSLPRRMLPRETYAFGVDAPPGMKLLLSVTWQAAGEAESTVESLEPAGTTVSAQRMGAPPGILQRIHIPLHVLGHSAAATSAAPFGAFISPAVGTHPTSPAAAPRVAPGVPFDVVCRVTNLTSSTAFELLELLLPPTSSLPGTSLRRLGEKGHGQTHGRRSSEPSFEAGSAASLVCLRQQATLGALRPGESTSVALELAALQVGTLREELGLRIRDLVSGGVFELAAPIQVFVAPSG